MNHSSLSSRPYSFKSRSNVEHFIPKPQSHSNIKYVIPKSQSESESYYWEASKPNKMRRHTHSLSARAYSHRNKVSAGSSLGSAFNEQATYYNPNSSITKYINDKEPSLVFLKSSQSTQSPSKLNKYQRHSSSSPVKITSIKKKTSSSSSIVTRSCPPSNVSCPTDSMKSDKASQMGFIKLDWPVTESLPAHITGTHSKNLILKHFKEQRSFRSRTSVMSFDDSTYCSIVDLKPKHTHWELTNKLYYCLRLLRVIIRIKLWMRQNFSDQSKPQTIAESNYYSHNMEFASDTMTLVFNRAEFSQSASIKMPLWARQLMEQDSSLRSSSDVNKLVSLLRKMKTFRSTFNSEKQEDFCRHCQYMCVEKRHLILRTGHRAYFSYLIFSGSVFVNVEEHDKESDNIYYHTVATLAHGEFFGEVSLIHKIPRTANVVTREKTELIVLDYETSVRLLPVESTWKLKLHYIRESGLFSDWSEDALEELSERCQISKYPYNTIIDTNMNTSEYIYMIIEGVAEVLIHNSLQSSSSCVNDTCAFDDPFSDVALYQRVKSPNQCAAYKSLCSQNDIFISLETLHVYDTCDLRSLLSSSSPPLILLSHGASVICIPKHYIITVSSKSNWKQLLMKAKDTPRYPSQDVFQQLHQEYLQWIKFKSCVVQDTIDQMYGTLVATKPQILKAVCGWNYTSLQILCNLDLKYKECLRSAVPIFNHKSFEHSHDGPCVLNYNPPITKWMSSQRWLMKQNSNKI